MSQGMQVPHTALSAEVLRALIEEFVSREGTDYGHGDFSLDDKVAAVRQQLEQGAAVVTFDPSTGTTSIVPIR